MKKFIFQLAPVALVLVAMFTSFSSPAQIMEVAQNNIKETSKDPDNDASLNKEYPEDIQNYIKEREDQIAYNGQIIAGYKWEMQNQRKEIKDKYLEKLTELDQKNKDLKERINEYKIKGEKNWELFIKEFNAEMDTLAEELDTYSKLNTK
jgi:hypothetical protein